MEFGHISRKWGDGARNILENKEESTFTFYLFSFQT